MDFDLDFVNPEPQAEGLNENEEGEGLDQPQRGEKSNTCNQCDYKSSRADVLKRHLKTHRGEKPKNAANATMHPPRQAN